MGALDSLLSSRRCSSAVTSEGRSSVQWRHCCKPLCRTTGGMYACLHRHRDNSINKWCALSTHLRKHFLRDLSDALSQDVTASSVTGSCSRVTYIMVARGRPRPFSPAPYPTAEDAQPSSWAQRRERSHWSISSENLSSRLQRSVCAEGRRPSTIFGNY